MQTPDYHQHEDFKNRSHKLAEIRALGIDPYPALFTPTQTSHALQHKYESRELAGSEEAEAGSTEHVTLAGRLVLFRAMGKNAFAHLQDSTGRIQLMFNRDQTKVAGLPDSPELTPLKFIEKKLDLGDIIGVEGHIFRTHKGELTVYVKTLTLLCKTLLPLPDKHSGLTDKGVRYKKRWLDLITHPEVATTFRLRSKILHLIRNYCEKAGFIEVETPVLQNIYGGAEARPFVTELNAQHQLMYLRISLEISLKKLIVGGMDRIFEISKVFRNEGIDRTHNPEFTMLEAYAAYWDYNDMMVLTEELFEYIALELFGKTEVVLQREGVDYTIDLKAPWKRMSMKDAIREYGKIDVDNLSEEEIRKILLDKGSIDPKEIAKAPRGILIAKLFEEFAESHLIQPHHIIDHPIETTPLCKLHRDPKLREQQFVERFESFILASEMCNSYTELNDPELQRKLLVDQNAKRDAGDEEAHPLDEEFVEAICQGMPPTGGLGIGIDRLVMLFTQAPSIRDVLFFPIMRSEEAPSSQVARKPRMKDGFCIDPAIPNLFPHIKVGVLVCRDLNNQKTSPEIAALLRKTEEEVRQKYTVENLATLPKIADWREAYRKFGFSPSAHRSSIEALLRRVLQGKELPSISPIVDLYNIVSLKYVLAAGGDDLDKVEGGISLTVADGTELFVMLGTNKPEPIKKGEVIYRDDKEVLCRSWNYRECEKTKITEHTKNVCLVLEGLEQTSSEEIQTAIGELKHLLQKYCQGTYQEFFLNKETIEAPLK
jgi:lysyl-tRNA synthetase class 2